MTKKTKIAIISFIILLIITSILLIIFANCFEPNLATMTAGIISALAALLLGIIALLQNSNYKKSNDLAQERLEKINKEILDRSVMPFLSLRTINIYKRANMWDREIDSDLTDNEILGYYEFENYEYFFEIDPESDEVIATNKESQRIKKLKNKIYDYEKREQNTFAMVQTKDEYIPTKLKNIGSGAATTMWMALFKIIDDKSLPEEGLVKIAFNKNEELKLNFYISDRKMINCKYELYIQYDDIYSNSYSQKFYIEIKDGDIHLDFAGKQEKIHLKEVKNDYK